MLVGFEYTVEIGVIQAQGVLLRSRAGYSMAMEYLSFLTEASGLRVGSSAAARRPGMIWRRRR